MFSGIGSKQNDFYDSRSCFKSTPKAAPKTLDRRLNDKKDDLKINNNFSERFEEKLNKLIRESSQNKHDFEVKFNNLERKLQVIDVENQTMKTEISNLNYTIESLQNKIRGLTSLEVKYEELSGDSSKQSRDIISLQKLTTEYIQTKNSDFAKFITDSQAFITVQIEQLSQSIEDSYNKKSERLYEMISNININQPSSQPKMISTNEMSNDQSQGFDYDEDNYSESTSESSEYSEANSTNEVKPSPFKPVIATLDNTTQSPFKPLITAENKNEKENSKSLIFGSLNMTTEKIAFKESETKPLFGNIGLGTKTALVNENKSETAPKPLFGNNIVASKQEVNHNIKESVPKSLFGTSTSGMFGYQTKEIKDIEASKPEMKSSIFGNDKPEVKSTIFGNNQPEVKSTIFGNNKPEVKSTIFGNNKPELKTTIFGNNQPEVKSTIFGNKPEVNSTMFGVNKPEVNSTMFGVNKPEVKSTIFAANQPEVKSTIFGKKPEENSTMFGVNKPITEAKPMFGSMASSTVTFGNIATSNEKAFGSASETTWQSGSKLFSKGQPKEEGDSVKEEEVEEHDPEFQPIIELPPLIQIVRDDDQKDVLFKNRGKLYKFVNNEWKERGLGDMKIFKSKIDGVVTMVMRREQVHKLCCNQRVTRDSHKFTSMGNDKSACWSGIDFSESESTIEKFAIKFSDKNIMDEFTRVITTAQKTL